MKLKTFLTVYAVVIGLLGLSMILNTSNMAKGFDLELNDLGRVLFRDLGTVSIGAAAICWFAREIKHAASIKAIVVGNLIMQTLGVIVNVADVAQGYMGSKAWGGIILHALFAAGFAYFYLNPEKT